jgi:hypothetical protein
VTEPERLSRRQPERVKPIRSWAELAQEQMGGPPTEPATTAAPEDAADPIAEADAEAEQGAPAGAAGAVHLGYRIVEEHLRQGRNAAQQLGLGGLGLGGLGAGLGGLGSMQALNERLLRDGLLWLESMSRLWSTLDPPKPGSAADPEAPLAEPGSPDAGAAHPASARDVGAPASPGSSASGWAGSSTEPVSSPGTGFHVAITSSVPVEIDVELRRSCAGLDIAAQDPRATGDAAPLTEVSLASDSEGTVTVTVTVPASQPPGAYHGVVYDRADGTVLGTLSIRVGDGAAA